MAEKCHCDLEQSRSPCKSKGLLFSDDILTGNNGSDKFVLAAGEGTDTVTDFSGGDLIGLAGGITFGALTRLDNNIILTSTNEILATLTGVNTTTLTAANFVTV